jgi:hypothetical protein
MIFIFNWHPNWYLDGKREGYRGEKMQLSFVLDKLHP